MISKRKQRHWNLLHEYSEPSEAKRLKDEEHQQMEIERDFQQEAECKVLTFYDPEEQMSAVASCPFILNHLFNDHHLVDREVASSLLNVLLQSSK
jgi:hypothetical protein